MGEVLVGIEPQELKFIFETKKLSSCSVRLSNNSDDYVAFKVKTTSPKRYCVRPNTGIILPKSSCDFTVTMQAQKDTPPDMQMKDKFLIQSTVVQYGTKEEDIVSSLFSKESGRYIQENKLKVVLVSPSRSPASEILNVAERLEPNYVVSVSESIPEVKEDSLKQLANKAVASEPNRNFAKQAITNNPMLSKPSTDSLKLEPTNKVVDLENIRTNNNGTYKDDLIAEQPLSMKTAPSLRVDDSIPSHVAADALVSRLNDLEMKLEEADKTIARLSVDSSVANQQRDKLLQDIAQLRRKPVAKSQVGFPFLFVVSVALISMIGGYLLHS